MDEGEEDENHIWNDWLPEPVALGIEAHEARRFRSLLTDAESAWAARKPRLLERPESVRDLSYRALIISTFVHARTRFPSDDLNRLVELALDIISETWFDVSLQRHWAKVLNNLLRKKKRGITLQIGWQQLYDIGVAVGGRNKHDFRLTGCSPLHPHIVQIMRRSRRFFPEGADVEIWAHFRSKIQYQLSQATHVNMAYLAHLMPTQRLATSTAPWNDWVDEWMNIWAALQHSAAWDCMWLHLLSFAAKHDTNGRIDWPKHAPRIWQTILQLMHLPLMGASSCPVEVSSTRIRSVYPISRFGSTVLGKSAARFIVYSLRSVGDAAALPVEWRLLQQLVGVLEQYYHPSNSMAGGYGLAAMLEQFLREACRHFMCRLRRQAAKPEACGAVLQRADRRRFAAALTQLASRAQFSKDPKLCSTACWALGRLAFVDADSVLPLVQTRFIQVLQSVGSSQQLRPAINSLACCIRPLLLCGLPQPLDEALDDQLSSHERGLQAVAGMMMETVPGVDINDPKKTAAVLGLYHAILCSLDSVWGLEHKDAAPPGTAILPLYLEEWVCGLLDRILAFLESAGTSQEYKMEGNSLGASDHDGPGGHLYELVSVLLMLMKKLPEELRHQTFSRLCSFLAGRILPGAAGFTSAVCEALVASDEAQGFRQLLQPLITALLPDIPSHASAVTDAKGGLSKGVEAAIVYRLTLLGSGVLVLNRHVVPHLQQLGDLAQRCLERGSRRIQAAAGRLLHSCIVNLTFYTILSPPKCPDDQREAHLTPQGVTPWVAPNGAGTLPPVWYIPGPAELAAANALLDRFVRSSAEQLKQMAAAGELANVGSPAVKQRLMGLLASLEPMGAVEHCLPDFPHSCPPTDTPFNIVGEQGPTVGTAELRLLVADSVVDALLAVHAAQQGAVPSATGMGSSSGEGSGPGSGETEVVASLMAAASMALTSAAGQEDEHRGVMLDSEPVVRRLSAQGIQPAAHSLLVPGSLAGSKKQYAPMDVLVRLQTLLKWRSSRAAFRALASPSSAAPELAQLHPTAVRLLAVVLQHSLHPYTRVRDISNNLLKTFTLRFPALVKCFLPLHLRGLSGLAKRMPERPPDLALQLEACTSGQLEQQLQAGVLQLCSEHTNGTGADGGAKGGAADGSSGPRGSSTMEPEAEAVVLGSTLWMMDHLSMLRLVLEDTTALSSVACAMILALRHPSVKAQLAVTGIAKELSGMLMPPPSLNTSYQSASRDTDSLQRLQRLLLTVTSQLASSQQGWRHACLAIGFLLLMLPGPASPMAPEVCRTMLETYIASSNPVMLLVSCQSLVSVLFPRCLYAPDSIHPDVAPQLQEVIQKPGFVDQLLAAFGSMHSHVDQEEQGRWAQTGGSWMVQALQGPSPHSMGMWLAIRVVRDFSCHLALSWNPLGPGPHALSREEFMPIVPLMATSLAVMAPTAFRTAIQPPLAACATKAEEGLLLKSQECALVELLTGTLSHADNLQGSAWEELKGLLSRLWGRAPFESSSLWSVLSSMVTAHLLRYGPAAEQAGSGTGAPAGYADTMDVDGGARSTALENWLSWLGQGPAAGANSSTTSKWLSLNVQALMQLLCSLPPWHLPEFVETYLLGLVNELERLQRHDLQSVRLLVGRMAALTHTYPLLAPLQPPRQQPPPAAGATARSRLQAAAADAWECAQKRLRESADRVIAESAAPSGGGDGELEAPVGDAGDIAEVEAVLGTTLELVSRGCNGMLAATLANRLAGFMTSMLQVQVLRHPRLQQLSLACRTSLACIKYVCFNSSSLDGVLQQIVEVPTDEDHWHMRAAGLQALQRIWFQHFLLLTPEQMQLTRSFVLARLADSKQEVRDLASATLSGLMKGFSPDAAAELRSHLLQLAKTLFKPTPTAAAAAQTRGGDAAARAIRTRDQHACVLGLAAITASSPYDIPPWLPEVLLALVDAASHPPPIRPVVSKALGNFRRTHELEDAQGLASAFQPDQWDAIVGVTSHASYFT